MKKRFKAEISELEEVFKFLEEQKPSGLENREYNRIKISVEEIFVNIANYAYTDSASSEEKYIDVDIINNDEPRSVIISFEDFGVPFNPLEQPEPDLDVYRNHEKIGGLGIHIVKKTMDNVYYKYSDNKNVFTIVKNI